MKGRTLGGGVWRQWVSFHDPWMNGGLLRCLFLAHVNEPEAKQEVVDAGIRRHDDVVRVLVKALKAALLFWRCGMFQFVMPAQAGIHDFRGREVSR